MSGAFKPSENHGPLSDSPGVPTAVVGHPWLVNRGAAGQAVEVGGGMSQVWVLSGQLEKQQVLVACSSGHQPWGCME